MKVKRIILLLVVGLLLTSGCIQRVTEKIKTPEVNLNIRIGGILDNNLELFIETKFTNPNPIGIDVENIKITVKGEGGKVLQEAVIAGGTIPRNGEKTFASKALIPLSIITEKTILTDIQTRVGAAGLDVKLPVQAKATVQLPDLKKMVKSPQITAFVKIEGVTSEGLKITIEVAVKNPNDVGIAVGDIKVVTESKEGKKYIESTISGGTIKANSEHIFSKSLVIPAASLNEELLLTEIYTEAGAESIDFRLPLAADVRVQIPRLSSLIKPPEIHTDITIKAGERKAKVDVKVANKNAFGFIISDVGIEIFDKNNEKVGEGKISGGTVSGDSEKIFSGEIALTRVSSSGDKTTTVIITDAGLEGVKEKIPIKTTVTVEVQVGAAPPTTPTPTETPPLPTPPPLTPPPTPW